MSTGDGIAASAFGQFMASTAGRIARILAGIALIVIGVFAIGGTAGWIVAAVGLLLLAAGTFDFWPSPASSAAAGPAKASAPAAALEPPARG